VTTIAGFGKHHASMYSGSMVGKGAEVFAVMGYVIANMVPDASVVGRMVVELNPKLLAFIIGEPEDEIASAIEVLCSPDPESRSKEEEGRRLLRAGQFEYYVVNGWKYRQKRDPAKRREQNREAQQRHREKNGILESLTEEERAEFDREFRETYKRRKKDGSPFKADLREIGRKIAARRVISEGLQHSQGGNDGPSNPIR